MEFFGTATELLMWWAFILYTVCGQIISYRGSNNAHIDKLNVVKRLLFFLIFD